MEQAAANTVPTWTSTLSNQGLEEYNKQGDLTERFDLDLRDPTVDGMKAFAAGYMQLGHYTLHWYVVFTSLAYISRRTATTAARCGSATAAIH